MSISDHPYVERKKLKNKHIKLKKKKNKHLESE